MRERDGPATCFVVVALNSSSSPPLQNNIGQSRKKSEIEPLLPYSFRYARTKQLVLALYIDHHRQVSRCFDVRVLLQNILVAGTYTRGCSSTQYRYSPVISSSCHHFKIKQRVSNILFCELLSEYVTTSKRWKKTIGKAEREPSAGFTS